MGKRKRMSQKGKHRLMFLGGASAVGVIVAILFGTGFFSITPPDGGDETPVFSHTIVHGMRPSADLDDRNFNWTLYGTNDPSDPTELELITTASGLDEFGTADFADEIDDYAQFIIAIEGADDYDEDDFVESFYERQFKVDTDGPNVFTMYENFTMVSGVAVDADAGSTVSANFTSVTNFTIFLWGNQSQDYAGYVWGDNYESGDEDILKLVITVNTTISKSDLGCSGAASAERSSTSTLVYEISYLDVTPLDIHFEWDDDVASGEYQVEDIGLYWVDYLLCDIL